MQDIFPVTRKMMKKRIKILEIRKKKVNILDEITDN